MLAFVTGLYAIREGYTASLHQQFKHLLSLLPAGTPVYVWTDLEIPYVAEFPTLRVHVLVAPLVAFASYQAMVGASARAEPLRLPGTRNAAKDTLEFLGLMNTKVEMLWRAIPFLSASPDGAPVTHLAWIDCGIHKIFKAEDDVAGALAAVCRGPWPAEQVVMPGCWEHRGPPGHLRVDTVDWRFCGGFFILPVAGTTLERFHRGSQQILDQCLVRGVATWEVNVWSSLESEDPALFRWFKADHNISMLRIG